MATLVLESNRTAPGNMADVLDWLMNNSNLAKTTVIDYRYQIARCLALYNVNRLQDISADIEMFEARFPKSILPVGHFKRFDSYLAWRKKLMSVLRGFYGEIASARNHRQQKDQWSKVLEQVSLLILPEIGFSQHRIIPIKSLITEARKANRLPADLAGPWLADLCDNLNGPQRATYARAIQNLEEFRTLCPDLDALLPEGALTHPSKVRRRCENLPEPFASWVEVVLDDLCRGEYDEISGESQNGKSARTLAVYRAALRKYLGTALRIQALPPDCASLADALQREVFIKTIRNWINEPGEAREVSDRTKHRYLIILIKVGLHLKVPTDFMKAASKQNPNMKKGKADGKVMPEATQMFCRNLLRDRQMEMTFRSLHLVFQRKAKELTVNNMHLPYSDERFVQFGSLAAFSAIALWGVPLRIQNMRDLRHLGAAPSIVFPQKPKDRAHILLTASEVKNKRPIRAPIAEGPTRALEVLKWYIDKVRPLIPWAERSDFLFPGYHGPQIGGHSIRNWLFKHTRDLGMPMTPHNFRHGLATLYLRSYPGAYSQAARLLCNTPKTVKTYYAWIDEEAELKQVQTEVAKLGGFFHET